MNFTDEIVYFRRIPSIVQSFMTKFDDLWMSTTEFANYANITAPLTRSYPIYSDRSAAQFSARRELPQRASVNAYTAEQQQIDVMMFRITDEQHTNAMVGGDGPRRADAAHHRRDRVPQPVAAVGRL